MSPNVDQEVDKRVELIVYGMHCQNCAQSLESALGSVRGVLRAEADAEAKTMVVRYDPSRMDERRIRLTIRKAGYVVGQVRK